MNKPRVLFLGTPAFAVPVLQRLVAGSDWEVAAVVTQPDRPAGRRREFTPPPVKLAALELGLPVLQPVRVRAETALQQLAALRPDILITAAYGQLLPQALLDLPTIGSVNVHASLLPRWRGAAPIQRAIMAGDTLTGITLMEMALALDAGPALAVRDVAIEPADDAGSLHDKLALLGADLLVDMLPDYIRGNLFPVPQPTTGITYAERLTRSDEWIDWATSAQAIRNQVRALAPAPGAATTRAGQPVKVLSVVSCTPGEPACAALPPCASVVPGSVHVVDGHVAAVACSDDWLLLGDVQPAGKRRMPAVQWLRGMRSAVGQSFQLGADSS